MFFTKWGTTSSLERALLNGKSRMVLVDYKIVYPYGVTVDFPLEHVYWVDTYLDFIERVNYDGSNRHTIRKGFPVCFSNFIYLKNGKKGFYILIIR